MPLAASLLQTVARALGCAQHAAPPSRGGGAPLDALLGRPSSSSSYTPWWVRAKARVRARDRVRVRAALVALLALGVGVGVG